MRRTRLQWTAAQDATILRMRDERRTWEEIAAAVGCSRTAAIDHGKRLLVAHGLNSTRRLPSRAPAEKPVQVSGRQPLPPCADESWQIICAGTSLAGLPPPVFRGWGRFA